MLRDNIQKALAPLNLEQVESGDYAKTGYHLEATAAPEQMPEVAKTMLSLGCFLESLTGLHYPEHFTLVYHFNNFGELCRTALHVKVPHDKDAPTISHIYPGAKFYDREAYELYGVRFAGHPYLSLILLQFESYFHPLLKKF